MPPTGMSPFGRESKLWVAKAAKMGYMWKIGDGMEIKFWEDFLFGSASLATQFWDLYVFANEHDITIDTVWDG